MKKRDINALLTLVLAFPDKCNFDVLQDFILTNGELGEIISLSRSPKADAQKIANSFLLLKNEDTVIKFFATNGNKSKNYFHYLMPMVDSGSLLFVCQFAKYARDSNPSFDISLMEDRLANGSRSEIECYLPFFMRLVPNNRFENECLFV